MRRLIELSVSAIASGSVVPPGHTVGMAGSDNAVNPPPPPAGLPLEVADQIVKDLKRGSRILGCLSTAAHLIAEARKDQTGLRLVESAAYNLREALDAVPAGHDAGPSGMPAVKDAVDRYRLASSVPDANELDALRRLANDLGRLDVAGDLLGHRTRQFLAWLEVRTGIKPLPGDDDPSQQFSALRDAVNDTLHDSGTLPLVAGYYDEAIGWFIRVFTPPDERVQAIVELARSPLTDPSQVALLKTRIAFNAHHLVRFFSEVHDPAWLDALFDDGLIHPPRDGEPWPVTALVSGAGGIPPSSTISLLERLRSAASAGDPGESLALDRSIIQLCLRLGPDAHALAGSIVRKRPSDHWVQRVALHIAKSADPSVALSSVELRQVEGDGVGRAEVAGQCGPGGVVEASGGENGDGVADAGDAPA